MKSTGFLTVAKCIALCAGLTIVLSVFLGISQVPPSGKILIRYCQWSGVRHQPVVWEIKKAFEKENPDIEVKLEFYARAYWQKIYTMAAAGCAPDVWYLNPTNMFELARKGVLEDLTPLMERDGVDVSQYYGVVLDAFKWRDRQYSLPMQFGAIALYYNRDLFDRSGVAYPNTRWEAVVDAATREARRDEKTGEVLRCMAPHPWTWDDLLNAARKLTIDADEDGVVDQYGFLVSTDWETCVASFIYQADGRVMDDQRERVVLDTPEAAEGVQFLQDLRWKHKVAPSSGSVGTQELSQLDLFETGKIAMVFDGSWRMDYYNRSGALNYDVASLPSGPRGHRGMVATGLANGMNVRSKNKEAAWKWIKFYAGMSGRSDTREAKAQILLGEMKRGIPVMKRIARSEAFLNPNSDPQHEEVFLDQMPYAHDSWPCYGSFLWGREKAGKQMEILLDVGPEGAPAVKEALKRVTRESNDIIQQVRREQERLDRMAAERQRK